MVCGVHFRSDIEAGRMAAQWLMVRLRAEPRFRSELEETTRAFRAAVKLPNPPPHY
jgi:hypothetical protein